jgi:hypothetical protein
MMLGSALFPTTGGLRGIRHRQDCNQHHRYTQPEPHKTPEANKASYSPSTKHVPLATHASLRINETFFIPLALEPTQTVNCSTAVAFLDTQV